MQGSDPKQKERGQDEILYLQQITQEMVLASDDLVVELQTGRWILGEDNIRGG